ncbi:MAG: carboxy terminal-processing peptidase [Desulfobacterales bacterium]|nr:carboxy terminal-processing peptidase [Desulfobacterales bacterium]
MKINIKRSITLSCFILIICFFAITTNAYQNKTTFQKVKFSQEDSSTCIKIINTIQSNHYLRSSLDDAISSKIFSNYFNALDPLKHLFLKEEMENFKKFEFRLDNTLKDGDLLFAFMVFNLYLDRTHTRTSFMLDLSKSWEKEFDFTLNENISTNKKNQHFSNNIDGLTTLWKKELKNIIIQLKLENTSNSEISKTLVDTYKNRLNYISQINSNDAFQIFMDAVTTSFDPHTKYFAPKKFEDFDMTMSLSLEGIGAMLQKENQYTKIIRLITAGPADKTKQLMPGDKIIGVSQGKDGDFINVTGLRLDNVVKLIRGKKGTIVRLKIIPVQKKNSTKIVSITRDKIKLEEQSASKDIKTIKLNDKQYKIGIIKLPTFYLDFEAYHNGEENYKSATNDVAMLLGELKTDGIDGLIVDLRGNGGGSLHEAEVLTGFFIKSGPVVQIKTKFRTKRLHDNNKEILYNGPLVVMINRMSASASEIFAGAIKDYNRGLIVGTRSFGKGTVQTLISLQSGKLKLTTAKFYRISGESTQKKGVLPDIELPHVYNADHIGESSYDDALPYDKAVQAFYKSYDSLSDTTSKLSESYKKRTGKKAEFLYLNKKHALSEKISKLDYLSLNLKKRMVQKKNDEAIELEIENSYLSSKNIKPVKNLSDLKDINELNKDFLLEETEIMTSEFIQISKDNNYTW